MYRVTSGTIVEFIGTQGIGKTTLHNAIYKSIRDRWFFRHTISGTQPQIVVSTKMEHIHQNIFFNGLKRIEKSEFDAWQTTRKASQMAEVIRESLLISTQDFPRGFILEEGLFKNFPSEVLDLSAEDQDLLWQDRAFIYLRTNEPGLAVSRFQMRANERRRKGLLQHEITDQELLRRIEEDNKEILAFEKSFSE